MFPARLKITTNKHKFQALWSYNYGRVMFFRPEKD